MDDDFFTYSDWRSFILDRFKYLKATLPHFSARYFAKKAGIGSASYFNLVIKGQRTLSLDYAERFAIGLKLNSHQTQCLLNAIELEKCSNGKRREQLLKKQKALKSNHNNNRKMLPTHVSVLSDPLNIKLYLLAQCQFFKFSPSWIIRKMPSTETKESLGKRISLLLDTGLWERCGDSIRTIAPTLHTGDQLSGMDLTRMHENLLHGAIRALYEQRSDQRIVGSRAFLFDKKMISQVQQRFEAFRQEIEGEFEDSSSTNVYQLHMSFFELEP